LRDRQIRYDINCKLDGADPAGEELADVEMTLYPDKFEPVRMEYYTGKLFSGQDLRGGMADYGALRLTYQISIVVNGRVVGDEEFLHEFRYYDAERGVSLGGRTCIITLELSKIGGFMKKPVAEMTAKERWAFFFRYCADMGERSRINEILRYEEGIAMAGEALLTISRDERERARLLSELKYELDMQSRMVSAKREGRAEGLQEGIQKGLQEGLQKGKQEGLQEGLQKGKEEILDLLRGGRSLEDILKEYGGG
jgi:hypothetical protein